MTTPVGVPTSLGWNGIGADLARPIPRARRMRTLTHVPDEGRSTTLAHSRREVQGERRVDRPQAREDQLR